jgi:hypothetical protein
LDERDDRSKVKAKLRQTQFYALQFPEDEQNRCPTAEIPKEKIRITLQRDPSLQREA